MVMQRPAKPFTPVRFRLQPPYTYNINGVFKINKLFLITLLIFASACNSLYANLDEYIYGKRDPTYNIFGEIGLITLPSAFSRKAGEINVNFSQNEIFKYGALVVSPFDWLEASYFYYRPSDLWWVGPSTKGLYLDKGFSLKVSQNITNNFAIAAGLSDFAGTGFFTREYLISSFQKDFYRITLGLGWGKFSGVDNFSNPLAFLSDSLKVRPGTSKNYDLGGNIATDQWFRGDASVIGGAEFFFYPYLKNVSFKIEYDPFNYVSDFSARAGSGGMDFNLRKRESNINYGLSWNVTKGFDIGIHYIKGNTLNLSFTLGANFSKPAFQKSLPPLKIVSANKGSSAKMRFYEDLIRNINDQGVLLQSAEIQEKHLTVAVSQDKFRNQLQAHALVGQNAVAIANIHGVDIIDVTTVSINAGLELNRINTPTHLFTSHATSNPQALIDEAHLSPGKQKEYETLEFLPKAKFPASFTSITPGLVNFVGDPARFYYGGINLKLDNQLQLSRRLHLNTLLNFGLYNTFDEKSNNPDSRLPHVRTDIVSYLQESSNYISRMQLDYFYSPTSNLYGKMSAGILEDMYGGLGLEVLYKPFDQNFSIGMEAYKVKKRDFDRLAQFLDYEILTGHMNFNYYHPKSRILGTLSFGRYLAGDQGYTLDFSRRLSSGFRVGAFFSKTNVSAELFGEGSFDKGFYFQVPLDLIFNSYRGGFFNFELRPLTRDGGQKLKPGNDLIGVIHSASRNEITWH